MCLWTCIGESENVSLLSVIFFGISNLLAKFAVYLVLASIFGTVRTFRRRLSLFICIMLKKFFISFLGSMAAIWLSAILFFVAIIVAIIFAIGSFATGSEIKSNSILWLNLHGEIAERQSVPNVQELLSDNFDVTVPTLSDMLQAIRLAATDANIDGIYIDCGDSYLGYASRRELVQAIEEFKKSGKWVYAYGDNYDQGNYMVASAATSIYINPLGNVDIHGISSSTPFFKNALDKLGVSVQVFKVGQFKSAVEPFLLNEISEPARLQTQVYIDSVWNEVSGLIASNLKIEQAKIKALADTMLVQYDTQFLKENKLVDEICYRRVFENKLRSLTKIDEDEDLHLVTPAEYLACNNVALDAPSPADDHIAVLYALGDITDNTGDGIVAATMVPEILKLADDDNVKGLVLRVNSGGGSAFASEQIWEALEYFKKQNKPFYVSMGDYAASGGYYISCGADRIFCDAETLTGSIGIFGMIPCIQGLLNNHLGVNISTVTTNANAAFPQITQPMTEKQMAAMQTSVEQGYDLFTKRVAAGRKMKQEQVFKIAEGRIWDGRSALRLGLVDEIGSLEQAIAAIAAKTKLETSQVVYYPELNMSPFEALLYEISSKPSQMTLLNSRPLEIEGIAPGDISRCIVAIRRMVSCSEVQARMEDLRLE